MAKALCTAKQFIDAWTETGGKLRAIQERFGFSSPRAVSDRRKHLEESLGISLPSAAINSSRNTAKRKANNRRVELSVADGMILVGSDAHVWPGPLTTAQRGFITLAKRLKPDVVVMNGDVFDGARISRHPAGIWDQEKRPDVKQEIEACQDFLAQVEKASPGARHLWTWGNHDARMEYTLAALVPQYAGVPGFALKDHFPAWGFCMAVFVNNDLVIKHRHANGIHAVYNNTLRAGRSMVTGHLHSPKVIPWTDYNGTRYGVDCGTLAEPTSKQFDYAEEAPTNHRAAFALLTVRQGRLLMPEIIQVWDEGHVEFRGELVPV